MADAPFVQIGRDLARGVFVEISKWVLVCLLLSVALSMLWPTWDSTDDRSGGTHSEMHLRTDHLTGCQYLESKQGSLTPRLSADGKQICGAGR